MAKYSVRVNNISKIYNAGDIEIRALDGISFTLEEGEFVAIVGPSGSGKSTLMNVLGTIDKPTHGEVYINDIPTAKMNDDQLAAFRNKELGFVFQAFNLINGLTAEEYVAMPLMMQPLSEPDRLKKAGEMLTVLGLGARLNLPPTRLSGGEQQRVAIARALVNNPTLVLADEPTGDLDTKSGEAVVKLLASISKERKVTIVMVTHNTEITKYCDKIIYIRDGKKEREKVVK